MSTASVARAIRGLCLGIWVGGIVMAFIAATVVFDALKDNRAQAGNIVGAILHTAGKVKIGVALVALVAEGVLFYSASPVLEGWRRWLPGVFLLVAIVCALLMILWIEPKVLDLRQHITDFSEATKDLPERVEFRKYHGMSMGVLLLEGIFAALALVAGLL